MSLLELHGVEARYGPVKALHGVSLQVADGEMVAVLGANGAGKTTTLRTLAGILRPSRGRLTIDGHDLAHAPVAAKKATAYIPDEPKLFDQLTVWETFKVYDGKIHAVEAFMRILPIEKRNGGWE